MKKYLIDGASLSADERLHLFQQIDNFSFIAGDGPPDINKETFTFFYEGNIEELKKALHVTCPIYSL